MRNKRLLAISAIAISASVFMTACSFGGDGKTDKTETVEVTDTPTPDVLVEYSTGNLSVLARTTDLDRFLDVVRKHLIGFDTKPLDGVRDH